MIAMLPLLLLHLQLLFIPSSSSATITLPGCPDSCGDITIPFPFGTEPGCHLPGFLVTCNSSFPKPILSTISGDMELSSISVSASNATVLSNITRNCHPSAKTNSSIDISGLPFFLSSTRNKFTAVGCDAMAIYAAAQSSGTGRDAGFAGGCLPFCNSADRIVNGSCNGGGCCQTAIPSGLQKIFTNLYSEKTISSSNSSSHCNYAFFVEQDQFLFNPSYLTNFSATSMPLALDWVIQNGTCAKGHMCGINAKCSESAIMSGYTCSCNNGFSGNPYLANGCQDINECLDPNNNPCYSNCQNTPGSFVCSCPRGYYGDGTKSGTGCSKSAAERFPLVEVVIGIGLSILFLLLAASYLYWVQKKRKLLSMREKYFEKNGGLLIQQKLGGHHPAHTETARIYTAEELKRATDNYSDDRILGRGGNGIVYKGLFPDNNRAVAIKKSRRVDGSQIEQFINEVVLLSQVIHKHVVRILGCCLETQVPLLVYEYISNGTLHHHLHEQAGSLSWEARLRIAAETAGALAYLHSAIERPIFHRDVKAANILLDENFSAKVTDFGSSRLIPLDRSEVTTMVQGTLGYLDPEYFQTGQLTAKSDVYSFGVVMAELLTGEKPISSARMAESKNLGVYFVRRMKEGRLMEILEGRVRKEGSLEELAFVAEVTRRCLLMNGEARPAMREVAAELERAKLWSQGKSLWRALSAVPVAASEEEGEWRCSNDEGFERPGTGTGSVLFGSMGDEIDQFCESPAMRESDSLLMETRNVSVAGSGSNADSLDARAMQTFMALDIQR